MATIAKLAVQISANSAKLKAGLTKATAQVKAFAKSTTKLLKGIGISVAAGIGVGIAAVVATVNKYSNEIDKMAKTADKLGISVAALQKLQYQAELTGVASNDLNKGLEKLAETVSDAASGTGLGVKALKELGLSATELNQMSIDQQFYNIADAMKEIKNSSDQIRLGRDLFGKGGADLVNTFNSDLRQTAEEFDKLGIAVTQQQAKMVEAFNDSKTELGAIFSGFGLQLTAQLAEPLRDIIKWITNLAKEMGGFDKLAQEFARAILTGIKAAIEGLQGLINMLGKVENAMLHIENTALLPKIAAERVASLAAGTPNTPGINTQRAFDNTNRIQQNIKDAQSNAAVDKLNELIEITKQGIGGPANDDFSEGVLVTQRKSQKIYTDAAESAEEMGKKQNDAAEKTDKYTNSVNNAANALNKVAGGQPTIDVSSSFSPIGGLSSGLSGVSVARGKTAGKAAGVTAIEAAKKTAGNNVSMGSINLDMQTDAGRVAGQIFAEPAFLVGLKSFSNKNTNKEARMAAQ